MIVLNIQEMKLAQKCANYAKHLTDGHKEGERCKGDGRTKGVMEELSVIEIKISLQSIDKLSHIGRTKGFVEAPRSIYFIDHVYR